MRADTLAVLSVGLAAATTTANAGTVMSPESKALETTTTKPRLTDLAMNPTPRTKQQTD
ncbi:hypothetical protein ACWD9K_32405 [Streptomyces sp. 900116325]